MPKAHRSLTLGVDLGGTKVEIALVDADGLVLKSRRHDARAQEGPDSVIEALARNADALLRDAGEPALALGIGVAGQVVRETGAVLFSPNLYWTNVPLRARLEEALQFPVFVTNDVRAASWGEWRYGAGGGANDLVCLFIGTGIGGGVVSDGLVIEGYRNSAGELGHMTIVADGRRCRCPNRGCLEAYAGGWAIAERAIEAVRADPTAGKKLLEIAGDVEHLSASTVAAAYGQGDRLARDLIEETGRYLAAGAVGIVNAFNPEALILGGGVIEGIPDLVPLSEPAIRARALPSAVERLRIVTAQLGGKAGAIGAAAMARYAIG